MGTPLPSSTLLQAQTFMNGLGHQKLIFGLCSPFFNTLVFLVSPTVSSRFKFNSHATFGGVYKCCDKIYI